MSLWTKGQKCHMFQAWEGPEFVKKMLEKEKQALYRLKYELRQNQLKNLKEAELRGSESNEVWQRKGNRKAITKACYAEHERIQKQFDSTPKVVKPKGV